MTLGATAIAVILITAASFTLLGLLQASRHTISLEDYMVSRNSVGTGMALATIVASAMGAWILFSPPEVGATSGIAGIIGYCVGQATPAALFAFMGTRMRFLMPKGHSLNEYVLHRFGNAMYRLTLAIVVFYMFVYLAAELTAVAKAVELMAGVPLWLTALLVITAVFIYTLVGGLEATIFTDAIQFAVIVPLLLLSFGIAVFALGGWGNAIAPVTQAAPELLTLANGPGIKFGATLFIAVIAAEMFNQTNWQRIYACKTDQVVRRSFLGSFLVILPMLFISGLLGILAMHFGFNDDRAFFSLIQALELPGWVSIAVLVLVLALVMSSLDSLLNGIASVFTPELLRFFPSQSTHGILRLSRVLTVAVGIPAILIASRGYNVLYLFLLADLVCAGALFPVLFGLYSRRLTGTMAFWSAVAAIATGALFFPRPDFSPWNGLPFAGDLLVSFAAPIVVSTLICLAWIQLKAQGGKTKVFDFDIISRDIRAYGESDTLQADGLNDTQRQANDPLL
ncbi:Na+/proline symporter [Nodosilinea sp. FACHB-131]|uniref:sodium:solute symporter family transporter n=1 Tax=Cyanophyceae TaxID=3028117 RepID=UPI001683F538|nr:Na+/proline symporter [Nodosilinea sp. FACHB-131]MBD1875320.1 Na+/proline symporter [Nodosilinea sp. FACHB-131]